MSRQAGQTLKSWRLNRHLTQRQLEALTENAIRSQSISNYEKGTNEPSVEAVRLLDATLDARGEIVRAFGHAPLPAAAELARAIEGVSRAVDDLTRRVGQLSSQVDEIDRRLARLEPPPAR